MTAEQYLLRVHDLRMEVARLSTEYEARAAQARSARASLDRARDQLREFRRNQRGNYVGRDD